MKCEIMDNSNGVFIKVFIKLLAILNLFQALAKQKNAIT